MSIDYVSFGLGFLLATVLPVIDIIVVHYLKGKKTSATADERDNCEAVERK